MSTNKKTFGKLALEKLVSNLLSVKVWLFLIPLTLSIVFLWWSIGLIEETAILSQNILKDNPEQITQISIEAISQIKNAFSNWMKFTGSLVVSIIGVREVFKVAKIKNNSDKEWT